MSPETGSGTHGVLLMAYGGPRSLDEVGPFLRSLTGREPSEESLQRVKRQYLTIGGQSPLPEIARMIATELEASLRTHGEEVPVQVGFRYTQPTIAEGLERLYEAGVRRVAAVSLSPFESETTSVAYSRAVEEALGSLPYMEVVETPMISDLREFEMMLAGGLAVAIENLGDLPAEDTLIIFTAHSLPVPDLKSPDPYKEGLRFLAERLTYGLGLDEGRDFSNEPRLPGIAAYGAMTGPRPWLLSYQSRGRRQCEWLGPDVGEVIEAAKAGGFKALAVQPIGFATDHMETLYDLDVIAAEKALDLDMEFARGAVPNAAPLLIEGLVGSVLTSLGITAAGPRGEERGSSEQ